jgi:hypothetical protein
MPAAGHGLPCLRVATARCSVKYGPLNRYTAQQSTSLSRHTRKLRLLCPEHGKHCVPTIAPRAPSASVSDVSCSPSYLVHTAHDCPSATSQGPCDKMRPRPWKHKARVDRDSRFGRSGHHWCCFAGGAVSRRRDSLTSCQGTTLVCACRCVVLALWGQSACVRRRALQR